ncbi:MAG TPA: hypothetical protein VGW40_12215 [Allosphingosinicella sp.]|nr:hypothetical protein [Allosphingosinicella sp.]
MSERPEYPEAARDRPPREPALAELVDNVLRKLVTAIVIAGAIIALAIYARPAPPRYQAAVGDGRIVRIDTRSGTVIACEAGRCATVLRRGQRLERSLPQRPAPAALPAPAAPPAQALPAPQPSAAPAPR